MNISPVMIKALFSALGVTPEQVLEPVQKAVSDIEHFRDAIERIEQRIRNIERHHGIEYIPHSDPLELTIEGSLSNGEGND